MPSNLRKRVALTELSWILEPAPSMSVRDSLHQSNVKRDRETAKLLGQVRDAIRRKHYSIRSAGSEPRMCAAHIARAAGLISELLVRVHCQPRGVVLRWHCRDFGRGVALRIIKSSSLGSDRSAKLFRQSASRSRAIGSRCDTWPQTSGCRSSFSSRVALSHTGTLSRTRARCDDHPSSDSLIP